MIDEDKLFYDILSNITDEQILNNDIYFSVVDGKARLIVYPMDDD